MTSDIEDELQLHDQDDTLQQEQVDIEEEENPINKEKDPNKTQEIDRPLISRRRYTNSGGNFITGVDITSAEAIEKRAKRAERFGTEVSMKRSDEPPLEKLHHRADRFGVPAPVINGELVKTVKKLPIVPDGGEARNNALLIHGTNELSTDDILKYFENYGPSYLEWINDASCVAVWDDPTSTHRAFYGKGLYPVVEEKERDKLSEGIYTPVWRLGEHYRTSKQLLLRFATTLDVKEQGSASRSKYYRKYGNPNLPSYQVNKGQRKDLRQKLERKRGFEWSGTSTGEEHEIGTEDMEIEVLDETTPSIIPLISPSKRRKNDIEDMENEVFRTLHSDSMEEKEDKNDLRWKIDSQRKKELKSRLGHQSRT